MLKSITYFPHCLPVSKDTISQDCCCSIFSSMVNAWTSSHAVNSQLYICNALLTQSNHTHHCRIPIVKKKFQSAIFSQKLLCASRKLHSYHLYVKRQSLPILYNDVILIFHSYINTTHFIQQRSILSGSWVTLLKIKKN